MNMIALGLTPVQGGDWHRSKARLKTMAAASAADLVFGPRLIELVKIKVQIKITIPVFTCFRFGRVHASNTTPPPWPTSRSDWSDCSSTQLSHAYNPPRKTSTKVKNPLEKNNTAVVARGT